MDKTVPPGRVKGTLTPPCSKSYAQRALAAALLTTWLPQALAGYLPWAVRQYLNLLPFVGGAEDFFRTNLYHWFGLHIWSPWPLLAAPVLLGALCLPAAARRWRHIDLR